MDFTYEYVRLSYIWIFLYVKQKHFILNIPYIKSICIIGVLERELLLRIFPVGNGT